MGSYTEERKRTLLTILSNITTDSFEIIASVQLEQQHIDKVKINKQMNAVIRTSSFTNVGGPEKGRWGGLIE
ncbi:hypothetical protein EB796_017524 [Bugula neritina]|uniref:Uncharacterized protein n=1 Tax=Bugula neritina TaxID=10212 RepID=A0A7J7JDB5_BUGNE|nr:hypothetical protein EB796_017524 [Bugula neritina]